MGAWSWFWVNAWPWIAVCLLIAVALAILVFIAGVVGWFVSGFLRGGIKSDQRATMTRIAYGVSSVNEERAAVGLPDLSVTDFRVSQPSSTLPKGK